MTTFLHTSDWQLGMTRRFLNDGRDDFAKARLSVIRRMADIVRERGCGFVVVCGDVFDSNHVAPATVSRALEAMRQIPVPVYLLPGNHDAYNDASVYRHPRFTNHKPDNVIVVADTNPIAAADGVELVGAPFLEREPEYNPLHGVLADLQPMTDGVRILLGHGAVDRFAQQSDSSSRLSFDLLEAAVKDGRAAYIALGDKHSFQQVDAEGRIFYSGTPEVTAFREPDPGWVAVVDVDPLGVRVEKVRTGTWTFVEMNEEAVQGDEAVRDLLARLQRMADKDRCVLRLVLSGLIDLAELDDLQSGLEHESHLFAAFDCDMSELHATADGAAGFERFTGFAADTVATLRETMARGGDDAQAAQGALALLLGLSREDGHAL
ncbi:MAG: DNA repair exonuclease [Planctomycetaceae bacterium]|nr:DNA repair exonuclease [Planctomycetaceae bacterium]